MSNNLSPTEQFMIDSIAKKLFVHRQGQYQHMKPHEQQKAAREAYDRAVLFVLERREFYKRENTVTPSE